MTFSFIIIGAAIGVITAYLGHPWYISMSITALVLGLIITIKAILEK